jgi:hypothetical protein
MSKGLFRMSVNKTLESGKTGGLGPHCSLISYKKKNFKIV